MKTVWFTLSFLCVTHLAFAQATSTKKLAWDQPNATVAEAQAYTYQYYPDGATVGIPLSAVICGLGATGVFCEVAFPAFTPGGHTTTVSASNLAGESLQSTPLAFTFVVVPSTPVGLRIR